jgi:serine protease Do
MAKGVAIISVNPNGIAANYGFQPGDIVRSINGVNINRVGELVRSLNNTNQWDMVIERGGRKLTLSVQG